MNTDSSAESASTLFVETVVNPLSRFFHGLDSNGWIVLVSLIAGVFTCGFLIGRARTFHTTVFQNRGEALVSRLIMRNLGAPDYHLMNHVTLWVNDGTTQVDHVLISRFGVFVIETKDYKGWIFGSAKQKKWTQVIYRAKFRFQNPIHQNLRHVRAVQSLLHFMPPDSIKSVVVFTGKAEFKTEMPKGVLYGSELLDYIGAHADEIMSVDRLQYCVGRLETDRLAISGETDVEHVQSLERRHGATNQSFNT